jgi:FAD/FMN-containing dehydrogenase/Fe-S oxidoreductase
MKVIKSFKSYHLTARGGGSGTNGQALNHGVIMDLSRYMNQICEVNCEQGYAIVEAGVVLDQLNHHLKPMGYFFAPMVSTSSRATIGGMANNDSSGKGSMIYGKTSDHVLGMNMVLSDGSLLKTEHQMDQVALDQACQTDDLSGAIYRQVKETVNTHKEEIERVFPKMDRFMSGYNLHHIQSEQGFNLNYLLCGSEGTLGISTKIKVKLTPLPKHSRMVAIKFKDFDSTLRSAIPLVKTKPEAVETIDDKVLNLAREDSVWDKVKHLMESKQNENVMGVNFVEYVGDNLEEIESKMTSLAELLDSNQIPGVLGYIHTDDPNDIAALWELRKRGVGLLGAVKGRRKPIAFVEDTAVPPENLADFIAEFRALLEAHHLDYGMFGHVDAGCLHVRPALDLTVPEDASLVKSISDQVVNLVRKYGGVVWGEHGRGIRSEYTPDFFGTTLHRELRAIKGVFDPNNQLNPGKIVTPLESDKDVYLIEDTQKRGELDRAIPIKVQEDFSSAMNCNGNGACHNYDPDDVMCPSSKVTHNRIHSPKGRAGLMREWLRRLAESHHKLPDAYRDDPGITTKLKQSFEKLKLRFSDHSKLPDYNHELYDAMMGCLSCKACATQCPIKVDIPELKSRFLREYHERYFHPLKDHLVAKVEKLAPLLAPFASVNNAFQNLPPIKLLLKKVGMVDSPNLSTTSLKQGLLTRNLPSFDLKSMRLLPDEVKARSVIYLQDAFTSYYESRLTLSVIDLLTHLGIRVYVAPFLPNGKPQHIKGFLGGFKKSAQKSHRALLQYHETELPIIGLEPSMALVYREEYQHLFPDAPYRVDLLQEWLSKFISKQNPGHLKPKVINVEHSKKTWNLFGHCTEKTSIPASQRQWRDIFQAFGIEVQLMRTGCCGMAGTYGHETMHLEESKGIYQMSWEPKLREAQAKFEGIMATGFSCRSQAKRFSQLKIKHPAQILLEAFQP